MAQATVEKLRVTLNRSFELARKWNIPGSEINPVKGVARVKFSNARERFLTPKEAAKLQAAVAASDNKQLANIMNLLLLTGARQRELLDAKWEHVDLDRRAWLIPTSKTGTHRYVPLSTAAIAVIELRKLALACGPRASAHDKGIVLIQACIEAGYNKGGQIVGALVRAGFDAVHTRILLKKLCGETPDKYHWRRDENGVYHVHA